MNVILRILNVINFPLVVLQLFTAHRSSTLCLSASLKTSIWKPLSIPRRFSSLISAFFFFYFVFFFHCFSLLKTENSWSNKAKSICQPQKPQRRPCSELLKYLTTNDDPPQTKPTENKNSHKDKCTSKKKALLQSQTHHLQGRLCVPEKGVLWWLWPRQVQWKKEGGEKPGWFGTS